MSSLVATAHPDIGAVDIVLNLNTIIDAYGRTTAASWGTPDTGPAYDAPVGGTAANYSVGAGTGQISNASVGVTRIVTIDTGVVDHAFTIDTNFSVASAATSPIRHRFLFRYTNTSNYYFAQLELDTSGVVRLTVQKNVAGVTSTIVANQTVATNSLNDVYRVTAQAAGANLRVTAYNLTDAGPLIVAAVTDSSLTTGTRVGVAALPVAGNTNGVFTSHFDNLTAGDVAGLWSVVRVYPDGTETELLGSPVYPSGGTAVLWDTLPPLDVPIFYRARSLTSTTVLTSNTVILTGTGDVQGWLRDPAQPGLDIALRACPQPVCPLDVDNDDLSVSLLRFGQAQFDSATGVFPIIDAARPRSVAQTRKARESTLAILSHTLAAEARVEDILASGRNLYLVLARKYGWAYRQWGGDYITVGDVTEDRPSTANMTRPHRAWVLPFALARPPFVPTGSTGGNGVGVSGATYGDATATGRTYADRTATGNTYLDTSRGLNL